MAKQKTKLESEVEAIVKELENHPEGASPQQLQEASGLSQVRTLQRRLALLIEEGKIRATGKSNTRRYHLIQKESTIPPEKARETQTAAAIALSAEGQNVLTRIRMPLTARQPVGYKWEFLDRYMPNDTYYLSALEREHLAKTGKTSSVNQPAGTYARQILNRLLIDLSWNSSRLEGNTYSLLDTRQLLEKGAIAEEKSASETQMILNHKDAIEFIVQADAGIGFNRYTITSLHALLSNNLLPDPSASGRLRQFGVGIGKSAYTPLDMPQLIEELFGLFLTKADIINDPFEQAFFVMVHLPYLQPFDDVNKRVSRLAANIPLNQHNLAPLSFTDVPQDLYISGLLAVYELNHISLLKDVFIWAYERSAARYAILQQTLGEPDPFRLRYRDKIREVVRHILTDALGTTAASAFIKTAALELEAIDQPRFIHAVETELESLHEGNFARYWVAPMQFRKWQEVWRG